MHSSLMADLAIVLVVAAATGLISRRLGQPSVLGYLFAGLIVGPYLPVPLFADPHRMEELAEVGVVLVMLAVGLEFRVKRLLEVLPLSGATAFVQIGALAWAGFSIGALMGWSTPASITLGATVAISSTMVVSAVLRTRPVDPDVRAHVFGVLVVQDVVAIALMAVVTALAAGQSVGARSLAVLAAQLSAVVVAMLVVGMLVLPRLVRWVLDTLDTEALVVLVAGAGFGLALAAEHFGYSVALGAFIAGMAIAESGRGHEVEHALEPLRAVFSALFFVSIGMSVDPAVAWKSLPLALALCAVVIGMQLLSVTGASLLSGIALRRSVYSGLALGQIGELSFILATIAIQGDLVPAETLPALVTVATITAFTTPMLLGRADTVVHLVDRVIPDRGHALLTAWQAFVRRTRTDPSGPSLQGPAIAVILDWAALIVLLVVRLAAADRVPEHLGWALDVGVVLLAVPFVVGLIRSGLRLVEAVRTRIRSGAPPAAARVLEAFALLAVVLAVGTPTVAVLRPALGGGSELGLVVALLGVGILLALRLGGRDGPYSSGVARLATTLARHVEEGDASAATGTVSSGHAPPSSPDLATSPELAGLDYERIEVPAGSPADGRSLAELDLRCRSGATVVAVWRDGQAILLPTGHEQLRAGDALAISGAGPAVERARALLATG